MATTRDELHARIERLPDEKLDHAAQLLDAVAESESLSGRGTPPNDADLTALFEALRRAPPGSVDPQLFRSLLQRLTPSGANSPTRRGTARAVLDLVRAHPGVFNERYAAAVEAAHDQANTPLPLRAESDQDPESSR